MSSKIEFLYLDEADVLKAGATDMEKCVDCMEEVYRLLGQGDYVMGGKNSNSHGIKITFPKTSEFPNMPVDGPDRRFMAMIAYLGGRFNIAGEKWYGSNRDNISKGLPRSILMVMLNDADTGAPISLMAGNVISSMRTGAIPGVGARYLARKDAGVCSIIGAGVIGRTCVQSLLNECPEVKTVKIYDIYKPNAEKLAEIVKENYPRVEEVLIVDSLQEAVENADVINVATSGAVQPEIREEWIKPGAFLSLPAGVVLDKDFCINRARCVVDNWKMYEAFADELPYPWHEYLELIAIHWAEWIEEGDMPPSKIENLGEIIAGKTQGRKNDDEIILFAMGGQPVYDVAWAKDIYDEAVSQGLGTNLKLWDKPYSM